MRYSAASRPAAPTSPNRRPSPSAGRGRRAADRRPRPTPRRLPADPVTVTAHTAGVQNATVRFITDEGHTLQSSLPATETVTIFWTPIAQASAYVRAEVQHPLADGTAGSGTAIRTVPPLGPMAPLINTIWLGHADGNH